VSSKKLLTRLGRFFAAKRGNIKETEKEKTAEVANDIYTSNIETKKHSSALQKYDGNEIHYFFHQP